MGPMVRRASIAAIAVVVLSQTGPIAAAAQEACSGRYSVVARDSESVLILDQQQGTLYECPTRVAVRCYRGSSVSG